MKKRVTRGIALSMSCMLAMSMMPATAFAGEIQEVEEAQEIEVVQEIEEPEEVVEVQEIEDVGEIGVPEEIEEIGEPEETPAASESENKAGKTIQMGTAGIEGPTQQAEDVEYVDNWDPKNPITMKDSGVCYVPNDYIYYGMFEGTPLKWRVLDAQKANDGATDGMFLLSENLLNKQMKFEASARNDNDGQVYPGDWQGSDAQAWLKEFAADSSNFTEKEQAVMLGVEKTDDPVYMDMGGLKFGEASLAVDDTVYKDPYYIMEFAKSVLTKDDKMFLLSPGELSSYVANRSASSKLKAVYASSGEGDNWWLRTRATKSETSRVTYVDSDGIVSYNDVNFYDFAIRPACNLNSNSVLFISAAENGKVASDTGTMASVGDYEGNEWKLTLKDESREFTAALAGDSLKEAEAGYEEWKLGIEYSGAAAGENEYVSALLCNENGDILFYGNLANNSTDGTAEMTLPKDLAAGNYCLQVFSQQENADKMTDYASSLVEIPLAVKKAPEPTPTDTPTKKPTPTDTPTKKPTPTDTPTKKPTPTSTPKPTSVTVGQVKGLKLSSNANSVKLTWKKASNAAGYKVERYNASKKKYVVIATVKGTSYTNKKLSAASAYQYRVRGYVTKNKKTTYGKYSSVGKILTAPAAPASVKIKRSGAKTNKAKAVLSFKQSTRATCYNIYKYNPKTKKYAAVFRVKGKTFYSYNAKTKKYKKISSVKVKNKTVTCTLTNLTLKADKTQKYIVRAVAEKKGYPAKTGAASKAVTLK